jgi:hypothetical protein
MVTTNKQQGSNSQKKLLMTITSVGFAVYLLFKKPTQSNVSTQSVVQKLLPVQNKRFPAL